MNQAMNILLHLYTKTKQIRGKKDKKYIFLFLNLAIHPIVI